jgi:O-antigen/teichoic acid export membrane protein
MKATTVLATISFPVFFGISCVSPELVPIVLGDKWTNSIIILQYLSLSVPFRVLNMVNGPLLDGMGYPDKTLVNTIVAILLFIPVFFYAAKWGAAGVALAWVILSPVYYFMIILRVKRFLPFQLGALMLEIVWPVLFATIMYSVVRMTAHFLPLLGTINEFILLIAEIVVGVFSYVALLYIFQRAQFREIIALASR